MNSSREETDEAVHRGKSIRRPAVLAWMRMVRVSHKVQQAAAEQVRPFGLSLSQFDVLATVGAHAGLTQQELADRLLVTKGNICQLLDKMQREDIVIRCQEGRANRVHLTGKGQRLFERLIPQHEDAITSALSSLSHEEQMQLHKLLAKLDHALG